MIQQEILDYLKSQRVGVLAVEMLDGSPHGATVHFANADDPFVFFFKTSKDYKKSEALYGREISRASFVVGADERIMKTLQVDGEVRLLHSDEQQKFDEVYLGKFPEKKKSDSDPKVVLFVFVPTWWRFTDWTGPNGKVVLTSN